MAKAKPRLLDEVHQAASTFFQGTLPWHRRLPAEHEQEVLDLRTAYKAGKIALPLRTTARVISKLLRDRGIANIGEQGVQTWLKND
jgi:hypothetical protein